jgi:[acyl-carrier-protein] S-malonyltransferase
MAALLGASDEDVEALCLEAGEVWPANYNCPGQIVASGLKHGIERLLDLAHARGIKAKLLNVDGAFHSSVMAPAAERLKDALATVRISTGSVPFLSATSAALEKGERLRALLAHQLTAPVRFTAAVRTALDMGVDHFVEFGNRRVLIDLVRRVRRDVQAFHVGTPDDLPAVLALSRRGG